MLLDPKIPSKVVEFVASYDMLRYVPVATVSMEMAKTHEHYRTPPVSEPLEWNAVESGEGWGENWSSAWFRGSFTLPAEAEGKRVFIRATTGAPEAMFLVDGIHRGVFDSNHPVRLLDLNGHTDKPYEIYLEAYAGHNFPGTQPFEHTRTNDASVAVKKNGRIFESVEVVVEREDVSLFVSELRVLTQLMGALGEHSLRKAKIQNALGEVFKAVYGKPEEVEEEIWRAALAKGREAMAPVLAMKNGPSMPFMGVVGHSHIDTAWLWPIKETWRKLARTYSSVLSLMDQYPEFRFTQSASYHYDMVRKLYPEIFARVQERVKEGRWEVNGAMWIEPDCNIPSGESFVRQCLVGQRATREMFGVTSDTLWQPDVFGYSAALPQILRQSEVEFFCTTKLSWNDTNRFPYDTFHWQGIDGTTVISHFNEMQGWPSPDRLVWLWEQVQHKDVQDRRLVGFGWGDGGGGPMGEMIESVRLTSDLEGCPKTGYQTISEFMVGCRDELDALPLWVGELYLELHRGTLTSIAPIKRYNRKCEFALRDTELVATIAKLRAGKDYPAGPIQDAWKSVLLNQFHDILPGSSIAEVNDEAIALFETTLKDTNAIRDEALAGLSTGSEGVTLLNSLSWTREGVVELEGIPEGQAPEGTVAQAVTDVAGTAKLVVDGLSLAPLGVTSLTLASIAAGDSPFVQTEDGVETPFAKVRFDAAGNIVSFVDKATRRELVTKGGAFNVLLLGEDVPAAWDNWDIDRDQRHKMAAQDRLVSSEVVANGPLQLRIRQVYEIGRGSKWTQDIVFHATTPRVDFDTQVEWVEKYQFLKVGFALDVLAETARHEIQFGHVVRSTHDNTSMDRAQFDVCAHKWTDLSETGFGVAFLNDCKYACTIKEGEYRLSLIKAGRRPDARGDEGTHRFAYAMLPHQGGFSIESVVRPAYEFNLAPVVAAGQSESFSLATVDVANVIIESVKWAEDGEEFIVRLYEAGKTGGYAKIGFGLPLASVETVNLLEEKPEAVELSEEGVELYFRPFEIKTLRCRVA